MKQRYRPSDDPEQHLIGGTSSGAICAFTVAWFLANQQMLLRWMAR